METKNYKRKKGFERKQRNEKNGRRGNGHEGGSFEPGRVLEYKEDGGNPAEGKVGKNIKEVVHVHNAKKELVRKEAIAPL